jgi:hypothetical protein
MGGTYRTEHHKATHLVPTAPGPDGPLSAAQDAIDQSEPS